MVWMFIKKNTSILYDIVRVTVFSFLLVILFAGLNHILKYEVLDAKKTYKHQILYKIDMAGIYALTGKAYADEFLKDDFKDSTVVKKLYDEKMKTTIWIIHEIYKKLDNPEDVKIMQVEWLRSISENFSAYMEHRKNLLLNLWGYSQGYFV